MYPEKHWVEILSTGDKNDKKQEAVQKLKGKIKIVAISAPKEKKIQSIMNLALKTKQNPKKPIV